MKNGHFYAASHATWMVTTEEAGLQDVLTAMMGYGDSFNLYYVPVPFTTEYDIRFFQPQVEGTVFIDTFDKSKFKKGKRK